MQGCRRQAGERRAARANPAPANKAAQSEKRCPRRSAGSPDHRITPGRQGKANNEGIKYKFFNFNGRTVLRSRIDIRLRSARHSGDRRAFPPAESDDSTVHGQEFDDLFLYLPKRTGNTKIGTVFVFVETTISNMPYENKPS